MCAVALVVALVACDSKLPGSTNDSDSNLSSLPESGASNPSVSTSSAAINADLPEVVNNDNCGIDAPKSAGSYSRNQNLPIWGYAYDASTGEIPSKIFVRVSALDSNETIVFPAARGIREDVAVALKRPELKASGFGVEANVASLSAGRYVVSVLQEVNAKYLVCNIALPITLN